MYQSPDEYVLYVLGCVDQYRCEKKSKTTPQVEDMKQQTKMAQQDMVIKGHCNMHMMSTHFKDNLQRNSFDLDSQPLMFNDGASISITNDLQDFVIKPTPIM